MSNPTLLNIGYGNLVVSSRVIAIVVPSAAPMKRLRDEAAKHGKFWEDNIAQRKVEIAAAKEAGMIVEVVEEEPQAGEEEEQKPKEGKKEKDNDE